MVNLTAYSPIFINLVNTDIPFEEYQLIQDQIDALKFRLLQQNIFDLEIEDLEEQYSYNYDVVLLRIKQRLLFLLIPMNMCTDAFGALPFYMMFDMSERMPKQLSNKEIIDFFTDSYKHNPNIPLIYHHFPPQYESLKLNMLYCLRESLEFILKEHHRKLCFDSLTAHYEKDNAYPFSTTDLDFDEKVDYAMYSILKKIYNEDYTNYIEVIRLITERNRII